MKKLIMFLLLLALPVTASAQYSGGPYPSGGGGGGSGDITAVGNCSTGAAFTSGGTCGNTLYPYGGILTIQGNEIIAIDLQSVPNAVAISSSSGVAHIDVQVPITATSITASGVVVTSGSNLAVGATTWNDGEKIDGSQLAAKDYGDIVVGADGSWTSQVAAITAWDDIADPDADSTIDVTGYKQIMTGNLNAAGAMMTYSNTAAAINVANTSLVDYIYAVDDDDQAYAWRIYDNTSDLNAYATAAGHGYFKEGISTGVSSTVNFIATNGVLLIAGNGDGYDENIQFDFNSTDNSVVVTSTTGSSVLYLDAWDIVYKPLSIEAGAYAAASIDGDDINSNAAGRSITLTPGSPDTFDADPELYTDNIMTVNIESPTTLDSAVFQHPGLANARTVTKVVCNTDTGTATINIEERAAATPGTAGTDILSADLVCDSDRQSSCASGCDVNTITNAGLDAEDVLAVTISATSGTPGVVRMTLIGTKDD